MISRHATSIATVESQCRFEKGRVQVRQISGVKRPLDEHQAAEDGGMCQEMLISTIVMVYKTGVQRARCTFRIRFTNNKMLQGGIPCAHSIDSPRRSSSRRFLT